MNLTPKGRNDGHTTDYSQINENIYLGSDLCEGMVCPIHSVEFKKLGINSEINLSSEKKEIPPDGIDSYSWIPVVDGYAPNQSQLDIGTSIINEAVKENKKIYIHCKNGHGRSPTLIVAYYMLFGKMNLEEAESLIKKKRPEIHIEDTQRQELRKFFKRWPK